MGISDTELGEFNLGMSECHNTASPIIFKNCYFFRFGLFLFYSKNFILFDCYFPIFCAATQIWELAEDKCNSIDFAEAIDNSDLEDFGFTDEFVIELWGAVTDARAGRHR